MDTTSKRSATRPRELVRWNIASSASLSNSTIGVAMPEPIEPPEIPPPTPGTPTEPPREDPPGNPHPEAPPPMREPGAPPQPQELPGKMPDEIPPRGPSGPTTPNPATNRAGQREDAKAGWSSEYAMNNGGFGCYVMRNICESAFEPCHNPA
jgi:hypothetical protein